MASALPYGNTLHDLSDGIAAVIDGGFVFNEETGEVVFDSTNVDALQASFTDKVEACCAVYESKRALIEAVKAKEDELSRRRKAYEKANASLRRYMKACMEAIGESKVETPMFTATIKANPPSVQVLDEDAVPEAYVTTKTTTSLDKSTIKRALASGVDVPGCALVRDTRLEIK